MWFILEDTHIDSTSGKECRFDPIVGGAHQRIGQRQILQVILNGFWIGLLWFQYLFLLRVGRCIRQIIVCGIDGDFVLSSPVILQFTFAPDLLKFCFPQSGCNRIVEVPHAVVALVIEGRTVLLSPEIAFIVLLFLQFFLALGLLLCNFGNQLVDVG